MNLGLLLPTRNLILKYLWSSQKGCNLPMHTSQKEYRQWSLTTKDVAIANKVLYPKDPYRNYIHKLIIACASQNHKTRLGVTKQMATLVKLWMSCLLTMWRCWKYSDEADTTRRNITRQSQQNYTVFVWNDCYVYHETYLVIYQSNKVV